MNRRTALIAAVAAVGGIAGVGGALWRSRSGALSVADTDSADGANIWKMQFDSPSGGRVDVAALRGKPLLLNFWATWCPPCVSELPLLDRFYREQNARGWQVLGLAVDNRDPVLEFLGKRPVTFSIGLAGLGGVELSRTLGNSAGVLPFTLIFNPAGKVVDRKLGVIKPEDLAAWVASIA
jgi:thiol-disulfide isomerase/thioredoxin